MFSRFRTRSSRKNTFGLTICLRAKASSCRVTSAARAAAFPTSSMSARILWSGGRLARAKSVCPMMAVSRLLKSWATPPARMPTASIFCECRSCSSSMRLSVTSRMNACSLPSSSRFVLISAGNRVPSRRSSSQLDIVARPGRKARSCATASARFSEATKSEKKRSISQPRLLTSMQRPVSSAITIPSEACSTSMRYWVSVLRRAS